MTEHIDDAIEIFKKYNPEVEADHLYDGGLYWPVEIKITDVPNIAIDDAKVLVNLEWERDRDDGVWRAYDGSGHGR